MSRGISLFLTRLFTNSYKDSFIAHLGATLILGEFKLTGPLVKPIDLLLRYFIGFLMETGVYQIELSIDSLKEGIKLKEFEEASKKAYIKATKKIYNEGEKDAIRQEYLKIISNIGALPTPDPVRWDWENT